MVTMKDVAKQAGVSISTVSNIINKSKGVNSEILQRVETAMKELGYTPNSSAQGLRGKNSKVIGVIFPDFTDPIYADCFKSIQEMFSMTDYSVQTHYTGDLLELEKMAINKLVSQNAKVIFLTTCSPRDTKHLDDFIDRGVKFIFIRRKPTLDNINFITIDEYTTMYNAVANFAGIKTASLITLNTNFSNEQSCLKGFTDACDEYGIEIIATQATHMGKERSFGVVADWIVSNSMPDIILTTSSKIAEGAQTAINFIDLDLNTKILALQGCSWTQIYTNSSALVQDYYLLGIRAVQKAFEIIDNPDTPNEIIVIPTKKYFRPRVKKVKQHESKTLSLLLVEGETASGINFLAYKFHIMTNIKVDITTISMSEYIQHEDELIRKFDIVQVHQPSILRQVKLNNIMPLNDTILARKLYDNFESYISNIYSIINGEIYGVPYVVDCQLMFYRSDLFNNFKIKRQFFEKYKRELTVPTTFDEYQDITSFFTQSINHLSPTNYGILTTANNLTFELLPRIVANCSHDIELSSCSNALISLKELYQPSDINALERFTNGEAAILVCFKSEYNQFINEHKHNVQEVHATTLPGNKPIHSGWSLCVSNKSLNKDIAIQFLHWLISDEISIVNNVLSGSMPNKRTLMESELSLITPWLTECNHFLPNSISMAFDIKDKTVFQVTNEIHDIVIKFLRDDITLESAAALLYPIISTLY